MISHGLDLPNLTTEPSPETLVACLDSLKLPKLKNFEENVVDDIPGLFDWLTSLISSDLDWIKDEHSKEQILDSASKCMSERCGHTACPTRIREMEIGPLTVDLIEPTLTADSLGLKTWGSSYVLANRLQRHHKSIFKDYNGNDILELGSGTGLCAIVLGKLNYKVIGTDLKEIVGNLQENVKLNEIDDKVTVAVLDWSMPEDFRFSDQRFQYIIVSDPIYSSDHPLMVVETIQRYRRDDSLICVQLPLRDKYENERQTFYELMRKNSMIQREYEEEEGRDDFGAQGYAWSMWGGEESKEVEIGRGMLTEKVEGF